MFNINIGVKNLKVVRVEEYTRNFTTMMNYHFKDNKLSLKAVGLMSWILSLNADTWEFSLAGTAKLFKDGVDSINTALTELEDRGYLKKQNKRNRGRFDYTLYTFYEDPSPSFTHRADFKSDYEEFKKMDMKPNIYRKKYEESKAKATIIPLDRAKKEKS